MRMRLLSNFEMKKIYNVRSSRESESEPELGCSGKNVGAGYKFLKFSPDLIISVMWLISCCCCINIAATQVTVVVQALPFPAPNLQDCVSPEGCCTPAALLANNSEQTSSRKFQFQAELPLRVRRAAHLVDDAYIAKYQRATELMRALPDTDGRSFLNQYKLHCAYCDNNLYFPPTLNNNLSTYPLEIHRSWLFYPWHRLYLYFHERILATLIDDETFALPFWNWDNQSPHPPLANSVPRPYSLQHSLFPNSINATSSLYDPDRTPCAHLPAGFVDFQNATACPAGASEVAKETRAANDHVMYTNMVGVAVTPKLFLGEVYRYGDEGGGGEGSLEGVPHATVHAWVNQRDMGGFKDAASDPVFFGHHANMDRLWEVWKGLEGVGGGVRGDIGDSDYLDSEFSFYDEEGGVVSVSVAQALQLDKLRYTYEEVPNPWLRNGQSPPQIKRCNTGGTSPSEITSLINATPSFTEPLNFTTGPLTFKLQRLPQPLNSSSGILNPEILELREDIDFTRIAFGEMVDVRAFAFHPGAQAGESMGCAEYLGVRWLFSHVGISPRYPRESVWRIGIGKQLEALGVAQLDWVVVTLTGNSDAIESGIRFTDARIVYSKE